jgi:hypothetical protein
MVQEYKGLIVIHNFIYLHNIFSHYKKINKVFKINTFNMY